MSSKQPKKPAGRIPAKQLESLVDNMVQQSSMPPLQPKSPGDVEGFTTSVIRLRVQDVRPYEGNPRTATNERISEICESISTRGLDQMFSVTKRPGESHYITAKGGCTRLASLQRLAQQDPVRFEYADFLLYQYKSESDLLAGHLVENIQREGMSFWDTAQGILGMKSALETESGRDLSSREFEAALKQQGLETSQPILIDYRFLHSYLTGIYPDFRMAIGRNDIRYHLRPFFGLAEALWNKHAGVDSFDSTVREWVSTYQDVDGYNAERLVEHLQSQIALRLGYGLDQVVKMLAILKVNKDVQLNELLSPEPSDEGGGDGADGTPQAPSPSGEASAELQAEGSPTDFYASNEYQRDKDAGTDESHVPAQSTRNSAPPAAPDAHQSSTDFGTMAMPASLGSLPAASGLMVATGLTPNSKTAPSPSTVQAGTVSHNNQQQRLGLELDPEGLLDLVRECAEVVGIAPYVVEAPSMPFGFMLEIPPAGALGVDSNDLAVQGWWLLANLSGQLKANLDDLLQGLDGAGNLMLPDTGPGGFRACLEDDDLWRDAVIERLGGQTLLDAELVVHIITSATHPMSDYVVEILACMRQTSRLGGLL